MDARRQFLEHLLLSSLFASLKFSSRFTSYTLSPGSLLERAQEAASPAYLSCVSIIVVVNKERYVVKFIFQIDKN